TPQNSNVLKTAMGTEKHITWQNSDDIKELICTLKSNDVKIYALESNPKADTINQVEWEENIAILVGNEALGIPDDLLQIVDKIVSIPLRGWKNSLNVGVATAICLYEIEQNLSK
ncbi:MAG: TrmH family RNA methyltransferase, partial [Candidatus Cloacimonetes bacterium]|nr:TrmH family RNA methyltransferase [Candidatus Cloacimonadota bacterium]